ncbi:glycerophosphodiester phosphodiesterase [Natronosalvus halobius]|uniref:glycerophosphodiester phosphodiesterase n=1 Tax=Natronosalvus halobius TaxID=2953746 RepID=UPI00209F6485|nr:glycerophosphodiester phosphodiesterase [Natronosalvus halobius]USZ71316.1 glycerophosphodiester phosphodiesterase [Natronosalvus halobius]
MPEPAVIAHRGFAGVAPENTIEAARVASEHPSTDMIEIDVQAAACGTPVVIHDDRLEGTRDGRPLTDSEGLVWEQTLEALSNARVLETDEAVPTLEAFLEAVGPGVGVNVELKNPGTPSIRPAELLSSSVHDGRREIWEPFVERVVDVCDGFAGDVLFSSFCVGALAATRNVAPEYPIGALVEDDLEMGLEIAREYDCEAIHPPRNAIAGTVLPTDSTGSRDSRTLPTADLLDVARDEGRAINVWTVDTWIQFDQLRSVGVDGIIVDYPGLDSR